MHYYVNFCLSLAFPCQLIPLHAAVNLYFAHLPPAPYLSFLIIFYFQTFFKFLYFLIFTCFHGPKMAFLDNLFCNPNPTSVLTQPPNPKRHPNPCTTANPMLTSSAADPMTPILLTETRQQNTEVRLTVNKMSDKVDKILEKVRSLTEFFFLVFLINIPVLPSLQCK